MAGTDAGFNAAEFRDAVRFAMNMGKPEASNERATFRWKEHKSYEVSDPRGKPYDWGQTAEIVASHPDVEVPVAVEFFPGTNTGTAAGVFQAAKAEITILDEEYALVEGADFVILDGNTYVKNFVGPPVGLFGVTVYTIYVTAQDEG
jgi:hypothetical protein